MVTGNKFDHVVCKYSELDCRTNVEGLEIWDGKVPECYNLSLMVTLVGIWKTRMLKEMWTVKVWLRRFQEGVRTLQGIGHATFHQRTYCILSVF